MQTFLPFENFKKSAECLDNRRLGKQRVETMQILQVLSGEKFGWKNHPAVKMWRGYEKVLVRYGLTICNEWKLRGFKDSCYDKILYLSFKFQKEIDKNPPFLGDKKFHLSHQSNLKRKDPEHYKFDVPDSLPYIWTF